MKDAALARFNRSKMQAGFKDYRISISGLLYDQLCLLCDDYVQAAMKNREFMGFTGNTQTSYTGALFVDRQLSYVTQWGDNKEPPIRKKIRINERVYLKEPYEGKARQVTGQVNVDGLYGPATAMKFLSEYDGGPKRGFSIIVCTGTEYSEYIESARHLDVLSTTADERAKIFWKRFKN